MKRLLILTVMLLATTGAWARHFDREAPRLCYGIEWGYSATIHEAHHYNYLCEEGYRLDDVGASFLYSSSATALITFGVNTFNHLTFSIASGFSAIYESRNVIPVMGRIAYYPAGLATDGIFVRIGAGAGFETSEVGREAVLETIGAGYRISLARAVNLDFSFNLNGAQAPSHIIDPDTGYNVPERNIRRNSAGYYALNLSVALTF